MALAEQRAGSFWRLVISAGAILLINMGARSSLGLFVGPLDAAKGFGLASIGFAFGVSQFVWGAAQPVFAVLAERWGTRTVLIIGALMVALGTALTPLAHSSAALTLTVGVLAAMGAAGGSFAILIGGIARHLPEHRRAFAGGLINSGASLGQFLFAPLVQWLITTLGWAQAFYVLAATALLGIPLAMGLTTQLVETPALASNPGLGLRAQVALALADRSYRLVHLAFFTCGFHVAFLATHLPGQVALCGLSAAVSANALALIGLFNIAGSLSAGALCQRYRMKMVLAWLYAARAVIIVVFLLAPKTTLVFYGFAAALGLTYLATVPPTAGLVGKLFGPRHLATLFGLTLVSHQTGAFFGAWLGGIAVVRYGDYRWMWYADIALALLAVACHWPIREARVPRSLVLRVTTPER